MWDVSEEQAYLLALVENLQREDLKPDEEAEALAVLVRERRWSIRKVAEAIHRDHQYVGRRLRVFEDPVLRDPVLDERLPVSTAEVLLRVPDASERAAWVQKAVEQGWRQMEVRKALRQHRGVTPRPQTQHHADRSEALIKFAREVTRLLDDGPAGDISQDARIELLALSDKLARVFA